MPAEKASVHHLGVMIDKIAFKPKPWRRAGTLVADPRNLKCVPVQMQRMLIAATVCGTQDDIVYPRAPSTARHPATICC